MACNRKIWQLIPGTPQQISHHTERHQNSVVGKTSVRKMTLDAETTKVLTDFYLYEKFLEHLLYYGVDGNCCVLDDSITFGLMVLSIWWAVGGFFGIILKNEVIEVFDFDPII